VLFELEFLWVNGFVWLFSLIAGLEFSGVSSSSKRKLSLMKTSKSVNVWWLSREGDATSLENPFG